MRSVESYAHKESIRIELVGLVLTISYMKTRCVSCMKVGTSRFTSAIVNPVKGIGRGGGIMSKWTRGALEMVGSQIDGWKTRQCGLRIRPASHNPLTSGRCRRWFDQAD